MTTPDDQAAAELGPGTDVKADLDDLGEHERPATSDPAEMRDGETDLGGTGGENAGGAG